MPGDGDSNGIGITIRNCLRNLFQQYLRDRAMILATYLRLPSSVVAVIPGEVTSTTGLSGPAPQNSVPTSTQ